MKILFFIYITIQSALSYPIFYRCDNSKITYKEAFNDNDLFAKILGMDKTQRTNLIQSWCQGSQECLKDFDNILNITHTSYEVAKKLFEEKLAQYTKIMDEKKIILGATELQKLKSSYSHLRACQDTKVLLGPENYLSHDKYKVLTTYPYYNNYMYITGCKGIDTPYCENLNKNSLDKVIEEAIIMGVDPYSALSLSLMEGTTYEMGNLYLDPIGVMGALGCTSTQVDNGAKNALNSYGTSYVVNTQMIKNEKLDKKLSTYFDTFKIDKTAGKSFYCYHIKGNNDPQVYDKAQSDSCCLELNFTTQNSQSIQHALTYSFIDQITKTAYNDKSDPAWRMQRYNGYTNLMGGAETVPAWRAGVNSYETPTYGFQAMDFIINSLLFNPYISSKVDEYNKKHSKNNNSILCLGKSNGTYYIDSDFYFNKHKESSRLTRIFNRFKEGVSYNSLSTREKKVLKQELDYTTNLNSKMFNRMSENDRYKLEDSIRSKLGTYGPLFEYNKLNKEEWFASIKGQHKLTEAQLNIIHAYKVELPLLQEKSNQDSAIYYKIEDSLYAECDKLPSEDQSACFTAVDSFSNNYYNFSKKFDLNKLKNPPFSQFENEIKSIIEKKQSFSKDIDTISEDFKKLDVGQNKDQIYFVSNSRSQLEPLQSAIDRIKNNPNYNEEMQKDIETLYNEYLKINKVINYNEAMVEYFKTIYEKRNKLNETSAYPWRKFNEEEVKKLVDKFENFKEKPNINDSYTEEE